MAWGIYLKHYSDCSLYLLYFLPLRFFFAEIPASLNICLRDSLFIWMFSFSKGFSCICLSLNPLYLPVAKSLTFCLSSSVILPAWLLPLFPCTTAFTPSALTFDNYRYMLRSLNPSIWEALDISTWLSITLWITSSFNCSFIVRVTILPSIQNILLLNRCFGIYWHFVFGINVSFCYWYHRNGLLSWHVLT